MSRKKSEIKKVGIDDVAAAAGVSIMTVSRALRGIEGVSEKRRAEIVDIARRLRYVPNSNARSLVGEHSALIGISFPNLFNDVFADILEGMRESFDASGFTTVVNTTEYQRAREREWVERVLTWRPSAMVLTGADQDHRVVDILRESGIPTLQIWDYTDDPIDISIGVNHEQAGFDIAEKMISRGYRRAAFVGCARGYDPRAEQRLSGIGRAFGDAGLGSVRVASSTLKNAYEAGYEGFKELWNKSDDRPEIVFFLSDHLGVGGMMACQSIGLELPDDVGLVGFNGLDITRVLTKKLTTVVTPRRRMGMLGAQSLIGRINGLKSVPSTQLKTEIILGDTTC